MKKALKLAKKKTGRLVDRLLPGPRSQSPTHPNPDVSSPPPPRSLPEVHAELSFQTLNTVATESVAHPRPLQTVDSVQPTPTDHDPIVPTPFAGRHSYADPAATLSTAATSSSVIKEFLGAARDGSDLFLPLKAALVGVLKIWYVFERTEGVNVQYKNLESRIAHLRTVTEVLSKRRHLNSNLKQRLENIATSFQRLTTCVEAKIERGMARRVFESRADVDEINDILTKISSRIECFLYESVVRIDIAVHDILQLHPTAEEKVLEKELAKWKEITKIVTSALGGRRVDEAAHDAQPNDAGCMPGTLVSVLSKFLDWVKNDPKCIFWLAGMAGTGKTSIAITLCRKLQEDPDLILGGSFFCSRTTNEEARTDVRRILPTLAALLAEQSPKFAGELAAGFKLNSGASVRRSVSDQMVPLLQQPLVALASEKRPIVFVIDALDECSNEQLLKAIASFTCPAKVKFILTSRPETHILGSPISNGCHNEMLQLHTIDSGEVTADIGLYINNAFSKLPRSETWYTESDIKALAARAEGLFIFASTIITYVLDTDSPNARRNRLQKIISVLQSAVFTGPLDAIYKFVLTRASNVTIVEPEELEATRQVLAGVLGARAPLSVNALAELLGIHPLDLREALRRLHAVVHVPREPDQPGLRALHASFGDYLFERAPIDLRISNSLGDHSLASGCMLVMRKRLCFNISQCHSSYASNPGTRPDTIVLALEYACLYWAYHLSSLPDHSALEGDISHVFRPQFLFWLETMCVLRRVSRAVAMLLLAASTVRHGALSRFLRDAHAFVASSREAIERCTAHIYLSAIPFTEKDSLIYKDFASLCTGLVSVDVSGIGHHGGGLAMALTGHDAGFNSISYSSGGNIIASGSEDGTVRIWDTRTGEEAQSPLRMGRDAVKSVAFAPVDGRLAVGTESGILCIWDILSAHATPQRLSDHTGRVACVAFSPDGSLLASAAWDWTVMICKTDTGEKIHILRGHENDVNSVVFSPAGYIIASGSDDRTIRLWQTSTGLPVGQPLCGHIDFVLSLSFSQDGAMLASGSRIGEIRLWDSQAWECIASLRTDSSPILSLHFSPDSKYLVTSSENMTVHIWTMEPNAGDTSPVCFKGHSGAVSSVRFSPDGLYIASASEDRTIRIWDARGGREKAQLLQSHSMEVNSVTVSTDGTLIVSGSYDGSVCVWDALSGNSKLPPLVGHMEWVHGVAVSSDGRLVASASGDHTIRIWNAQTGDAIGEPLKMHSGAVLTVGFSLDGRWLASGSNDRTVLIWKVDGQQQATADPLICNDTVWSVAFSPDSQLVAAGDGSGCIHLWKTETGQRVCEPIQAVDSQAVHSIAFSPAGTHIASGELACVGRVWDINTGRPILTLAGHTDGVSSINFSPSGRLICTGSDDFSIRLWDAATGTQVSFLYGHVGSVRTVVFAPDERSIVSCSHDGTVRVWDVAAACERLSDTDDDKNPVTALASTRIDDGWLLGRSGELLMWVPAEYRVYIQVSPCTMVIGKHRIVITADDNGLHHGEGWTACWRKAPSR